jgi:hypothetical protein
MKFRNTMIPEFHSDPNGDYAAFAWARYLEIR